MDIFQDWLTTMYRVVVSPKPDTFITESKKANGNFTSAIFWLLFLTLIFHVFIYISSQYVFPISSIIVTLIFVPLVFLFYVFSVDLFYKRLFNRKKNYYNELLYLMTSIFSPFYIISLFTLLLPNKLGTILGWITTVYPILLVTLVLKSLVKLKFWQAITVILLATALAAGGVFCIPAFIFSLIGSVPGVIF